MARLPQTAQLPVSLVVTGGAGPDELKRALDSVAAQSRLLPSEVIVAVPRGDTADSEAGEAAGATVVEGEPGLGRLSNLGLKTARHWWVAFLRAKDEWLNHHLAVLWELRGDHVLVSSACGGEGKHERRRVPRPWGAGPEELESPADVLRPGPPPLRSMSTVMLNKHEAESAGGFDPALGSGASLELWLRILERGTGIATPEVTVKCRARERELSAS